jgi:hypothetical protein
MSVKSGGIALGPGNVQTMTLTGAGTYANVGATFQVTASDNETTGVDTVQLTVQGVLGPVTMQWTCRNVPGCLEIVPTG